MANANCINPSLVEILDVSGGDHAGRYTLAPNGVLRLNGEDTGHQITEANLEASGVTYTIKFRDDLTSIGTSMFENCSGLTSVEFGPSLETFSNNAFKKSGLTSVVIPDSVKSIQDGAFHDCDNLLSLTIGNGVTSIGQSAFSYSGKLKSVEFGPSLESIGDYAFKYCGDLGGSILKFPDSLISIGTEAFANCGVFERVIFGKSIKNLGNAIFQTTTVRSLLFNFNKPDSDYITSYKQVTNIPTINGNGENIPYPNATFDNPFPPRPFFNIGGMPIVAEYLSLIEKITAIKEDLGLVIDTETIKAGIDAIEITGVEPSIGEKITVPTELKTLLTDLKTAEKDKEIREIRKSLITDLFIKSSRSEIIIEKEAIGLSESVTDDKIIIRKGVSNVIKTIDKPSDAGLYVDFQVSQTLIVEYYELDGSLTVLDGTLSITKDSLDASGISTFTITDTGSLSLDGTYKTDDVLNLHDTTLILGSVTLTSSSASGSGSSSGSSSALYKNEDIIEILEKKLTASDRSNIDNFGNSVAISGNTAIIGAKRDDSDKGSAYIFENVDGSWNEIQKLTASDGFSSDAFGHSVAISGNTAIVGSPGNNSMGAAYIFENVDGSWTEHKLIATGVDDFENFGNSVAISENIAIIGNSIDDGAGSAYIFEKEDGSWTQKYILTASANYFGNSVAISGNTAIVGAASGVGGKASAYIFEKDGDSWTEKYEFTGINRKELDILGKSNSVAISGNTAIVGADGDDSEKGSAYIFENVDGSWNQVQKLTDISGVDGDNFGSSVAISGNTAIVGANGDDNEKGSAYIFGKYIDGTWKLIKKLTSSDGISDDYFGTSVAISDNTAIVGANGDTISSDHVTFDNIGSAYIFTIDIVVEEDVAIETPSGSGSSSGDPHVYPIVGKMYELPIKEATYRMVDGNDLIVNASTRNMTKNEGEAIKKYYEIQTGKKCPVDLMTSGVFYNKVYLESEGEKMEFNFDTKEGKCTSDYFKLSKKVYKHKKVSKYEVSEVMSEVNVSFKHNKYGKVVLSLRKFSNPQIENGIGLKMTKYGDVKGLLIREYETSSMEVSNIRSKEEVSGVLGKNKVQSKMLIHKN